MADDKKHVYDEEQGQDALVAGTHPLARGHVHRLALEPFQMLDAMEAKVKRTLPGCGV